jgi:hypothetical protein
LKEYGASKEHSLSFLSAVSPEGEQEIKNAVNNIELIFVVRLNIYATSFCSTYGFFDSFKDNEGPH